MQLLPRLLSFVFFFLFALHISALKTTTTPDGRVIRIPGSKPAPLDVSSSLKSINDNITGRERLPKPKPSSVNGRPDESQEGSIDGFMCGLESPTAESWKANQDDISEWVTAQYYDYLDHTHNSFALFLRDRWAPDVLGSGLFCDAVGSCSIVSCSNLIPDNGENHHDRQMALFIFEFIANYDHLLSLVRKASDDVINHILHRSDQLVEDFSSAPRIEKALKDELKKEQIGLAIATSLGLVISGGVGMIAGGPGAAAASATVALVVNSYIGLVTTINEFRDNPDFVHDFKEAFHNDLTEVLYKAKRSVDLDLHDLMIGAPDTQNKTILDHLTSGDFLPPNADFSLALGDHIGRVVTGTALNKLWEFDRAYFVLADSPNGCMTEKNSVWSRGPKDYLVCLPEHPNLEFWLFSIDRYHENDAFRDDQAMVRGPTGWFLLDGDSKYYGLTLQDVARSSYWVHQENLVKRKGKRIEMDPLSLNATIRASDDTLGRVPGTFTIPICRNPGGESISGVLDMHGTNYPCMCGEFNWTNGWTAEKDETPTFLLRSAFEYSEDWEDYCSSHNHCHGADELDLHRWLNDRRELGDPEIPKDLKHNFWECKKRRDSQAHRGWPGRDMGTEAWKRNRLGWAIHDERKRNTSRTVISFEG